MRTICQLIALVLYLRWAYILMKGAAITAFSGKSKAGWTHILFCFTFVAFLGWFCNTAGLFSEIIR